MEFIIAIAVLSVIIVSRYWYLGYHLKKAKEKSKNEIRTM